MTHQPPTPGHLCLLARRASGLRGVDVCRELSITRPTLTAWERTGNMQLIRFWRERGYPIETTIVSEVRRQNDDRTILVGRPIRDLGVSEARSGTVYRRVHWPSPGFREYAVDEARGRYILQFRSGRKRRRLLITYEPAEAAEEGATSREATSVVG